MTGPRRPRRAEVDLEGWTEVVVGAQHVLRGLCARVERIAETGEQEDDGGSGEGGSLEVVTSFLLGLVAIGQAVDRAVAAFDDGGEEAAARDVPPGWDPLR